jgi:hypothetical protein
LWRGNFSIGVHWVTRLFTTETRRARRKALFQR